VPLRHGAADAIVGADRGPVAGPSIAGAVIDGRENVARRGRCASAPRGAVRRTRRRLGATGRMVSPMASRSTQEWLDPAVSAYVAERAAPPDQVQQDLIRETIDATGDRSIMQISPDQGALISLLVGITGARLAVEVGTFTGYSALCIARAMGSGSRLVCCDVSEEWTAIGRRHWERAGVADRIELHLGPAADTLATLDLPADLRAERGGVDVAFIDADKTNYWTYVELLLPLMRPSGLLLVDNTLWSAQVLRPTAEGDADTAALKAFNDRVAADPRIESYLLPVSDGLTLIRKR
jgi:caffeoyl-CoA O-methyltransferase